MLNSWLCVLSITAIRWSWMQHGGRPHLRDLEIALIGKHPFSPLFSCPMHMFLCKGKMLFFHSLINQRLFYCFKTRKIQIFLKVMLDCWIFTCCSSSGWRFCSSKAVKRGFIWSSRFMMVPISRNVFLLLPPPNLCLGTVLFGSSLATAKSLMMVAFPFPFRSYMTFIGIFSCFHARIRAFSSSLVYFPGILSKLQIFNTPLHKLTLIIRLTSNLLWFSLVLLCILIATISHKNSEAVLFLTNGTLYGAVSMLIIITLLYLYNVLFACPTTYIVFYCILFFQLLLCFVLWFVLLRLRNKKTYIHCLRIKNHNWTSISEKKFLCCKEWL